MSLGVTKLMQPATEKAYEGNNDIGSGDVMVVVAVVGLVVVVAVIVVVVVVVAVRVVV